MTGEHNCRTHHGSAPRELQPLVVASLSPPGEGGHRANSLISHQKQLCTQYSMGLSLGLSVDRWSTSVVVWGYISKLQVGYSKAHVVTGLHYKELGRGGEGREISINGK